MSKKLTKTIAAIACAAMMTTSMFAMDAAAAVANGGYYYYYNGVYYSSSEDATLAAGGNAGAYVPVADNAVPSSATEKWLDPRTPGKYYNSEAAAKADGVASPRRIYLGTYYTSTSSDAYYSNVTKKYYRTYEAAVIASNGNTSAVIHYPNYYNYGYGYGYDYGYAYGRYYSTVTKKYYTTYEAALAASNGIRSNVITYDTSYYNYGNGVSGSIYRYYYNGVAYATLADAIAAGGTALGVDIYYSPVGSTGSTTYYYHYNGTYYGSLSAAIAAGGTALGIDIDYVPYNYYGSKNYTYGYGYYGYNNLLNPLHYNTIWTNNKTVIDTAEDGEPYIYGRKTKAGWKTIIEYIKDASRGSTIKVDMNGATIIDDSVLDALDGKNVSVTFVLENGVKWTINGKDIDEVDDLSVYTEYNIDAIPATLVKKAAKNAVSKAQVGISIPGEDFGAEATVTVKFSERRSDCTAVVYMYDATTNSLKGVYKSKVQKDGSCSFSAKVGGPYLIVLQ